MAATHFCSPSVFSISKLLLRILPLLLVCYDFAKFDGYSSDNNLMIDCCILVKPTIYSILRSRVLGVKPRKVKLRPLCVWMKRGHLCVSAGDRNDYLYDLAMCMDIQSNPGPNRTKSSSTETNKVARNASLSIIGYSRSTLFKIRRSGGKFKLNAATVKTLKENTIFKYRGIRGGKTIAGRTSHIPVHISSRLNIHTERYVDYSSLVTVQCTSSPADNTLHQAFKYCLWNAQSLVNKSSAFVQYACHGNVDLFAVTETWFSTVDAIKVECTPSGYKLLDCPRVGRTGGGIALLYRDSLSVEMLTSGEKDSFEFCEVVIFNANTKLFRLLIIYRPPYSQNHPVTANKFLLEFAEFLEEIILAPEPLLITGDFNFHVDNLENNIEAAKLVELLDSMGLVQHVQFPTHEHGHTLDLIISRMSDSIIVDSPSPSDFLSDHCIVTCGLKANKPPVTSKNITFRKIKSIDTKAFKHDLSVSDLCLNTPVELCDLINSYNSTLAELLDKHAPLIKKTVYQRPRVPWFSDAIKTAIIERRRMERKWRKSKLEVDRQIFKQYRNKATFLMNTSKCKFYTEFVKDNSTDQRKLFMAAKQLLSDSTDVVYPPHTDSVDLANGFGRFFIKKITDIRSKFDNAPESTEVNSDSSSSELSTASVLHQFNCLSQEDIGKLVAKAPNKSCALDPAPTTVVKSCLDVLLPVIMNMVNMSLLTGHFPDVWKEAVVIPLLKKPKLKPLFKNYRPVSNLPFISKLAEKAVISQLNQYMIKNNLYPDNQSAYRSFHSTETALLKVKNDIQMNMNSQHVTLLVLLDLSAAFDTVDHSILTNRLNTRIGISGTALSWFNSYLSGRKQKIQIFNRYSDNFPLDCGVPQGSCLGPLLFSIYASKLFDIVNRHLPDVHCFADDTQLYLAFKPDASSNETTAITAMENCIQDIRSWMFNDKLMINDEKTEFMIIGTHQQLAKISSNSISVGDADIFTSKKVRNLGSWFDTNMSMEAHITNISKGAFFHLHNISRIRKYLNIQSTQVLIHAFVSSKIDYCNSLLFGIPKSQLAKLQRVQNAAARLISNIGRRDRITPVLRELHWLPVQYRIDFKILLITFKILNGLAPIYLKNLISVKPTGKYNLRSTNELLLMQPTFKTYSTLGDRAFAVAAPKLWNNLPVGLKNIKLLDIFKKEIKTHLFRKAFY